MYSSLTLYSQESGSFRWLIFPSNIACKELKIAQFAQVNQLLQFFNLARIYGIRAAIAGVLT